MKRKDRLKYLTIFGTILVLLSACQHNPSKNIVVNKNDGTFDASIVVSAEPNQTSDSVVSFTYSKDFTNTNEDVKFQMNIHEEIPLKNMPVVEVSPHYLSENEAKRIAEVLFGNADFYEKDTIVLQEEIKNCIERWVPYTNRTLMSELFPTADDAYIDWRIDLLKKAIEAYSEEYDFAPTENIKRTCEWVYKKDSYYTVPSKQYSPDEHKDDNDSIQVTTTVNGIPYYYCASMRNNSDYKLSSVFAFPREYIVGDKAMYIAQLCRTKKPSTSQIEEVKKKAEDILAQIQIGEWEVDEYFLETTEMNEYIIHISATPKLHGVAALRTPQLSNLKSKEVFASNYYLSEVIFEFSPNGDILFFELQSPLEITAIINENVAVLDFPELLERAQEHLALSDIHTYDFNSIVDTYKNQGVELSCVVEIDKLEYNLIRVKKPNADNIYYYIPGMILGGHIDYLECLTGDLVCESEQSQLLAINAIDGSIVHLDNGE